MIGRLALPLIGVLILPPALYLLRRLPVRASLLALVAGLWIDASLALMVNADLVDAATRTVGLARILIDIAGSLGFLMEWAFIRDATRRWTRLSWVGVVAYVALIAVDVASWAVLHGSPAGHAAVAYYHGYGAQPYPKFLMNLDEGALIVLAAGLAAAGYVAAAQSATRRFARWSSIGCVVSLNLVVVYGVMVALQTLASLAGASPTSILWLREPLGVGALVLGLGTIWANTHGRKLVRGLKWGLTCYLEADLWVLRTDLLSANCLVSDRFVHLVGAAHAAFIHGVERACRRASLSEYRRMVTVEAARWIVFTRVYSAGAKLEATSGWRSVQMLDLSRLAVQKSMFEADVYCIGWLALRPDERPIAEPLGMALWHRRAAALVTEARPLAVGQAVSGLGRRGLAAAATLRVVRGVLWAGAHLHWLNRDAERAFGRYLSGERATLRRDIAIANSLISDRMVHLTGAADEAFAGRVGQVCRRAALTEIDRAVTIEAARWITSTRAVRATAPWAGAPARRATTPSDLTPLAIDESTSLADTYRIGYLALGAEDRRMVRMPRLITRRHRQAAALIRQANWPSTGHPAATTLRVGS